MFFCPNIALDNAQAILLSTVQDFAMVQDNNEVLSAQDNIDQVILPILFKIMLPYKTIMKFFLKNL